MLGGHKWEYGAKHVRPYRQVTNININVSSPKKGGVLERGYKAGM